MRGAPAQWVRGGCFSHETHPATLQSALTRRLLSSRGAFTLQLPACRTCSQQDLGQACPNKKLPHRGRKFLKIENLWPRDESCPYEQQKTQNCAADSANSSGFLVIRSKYCFTEPLQFRAAGHLLYVRKNQIRAAVIKAIL